MQQEQSPLMLGVSGLRGIVGQSLTPEVAARYAAAFGTWLGENTVANETGGPRVVLGRDSRQSGEMLELAVAAGLSSVGCRVLRLGVASTPGVAIMVEHERAAGGMVVTASHNPAEWNGLKILRHDGIAPPPEQAQAVIDRFHRGEIAWVGVDHLQRTRARDDIARIHADVILPHINVESVRAAGLNVVVDSVHGAGGGETLALLDGLGIRTGRSKSGRLSHYFSEPTGRFPHPPEPTRENLIGLSEAVRREGAMIGFAQDPDADRLAVVDEGGRYIGEEYTLALCAGHVLKSGDVAGANLSTSRMIDDIAAAAGATVVRTPVGEANVAAGMRAHGAVIGGEGNGGVIWPRVVAVRDSLVGIALLLEMLAVEKKPLSELVDELTGYAMVKTKVPFDPDLAARLTPMLERSYADQKLDLNDGVRIDWPDRWIHVRPSNTEPILRLIAEAPDAAGADALIEDVRQTLGLDD